MYCQSVFFIKLIPYIVVGGISYTVCNDIYKRYVIKTIENEKLAITHKFIINNGAGLALIFGYIKQKYITFE